MHTQSNIFTTAEIKAIEKRKNGDNRDRTGIFNGRVKPKIKEILNVWLNQTELLKSFISQKQKKT